MDPLTVAMVFTYFDVQKHTKYWDSNTQLLRSSLCWPCLRLSSSPEEIPPSSSYEIRPIHWPPRVMEPKGEITWIKPIQLNTKENFYIHTVNKHFFWKEHKNNSVIATVANFIHMARIVSMTAWRNTM